MKQTKLKSPFMGGAKIKLSEYSEELFLCVMITSRALMRPPVLCPSCHV